MGAGMDPATRFWIFTVAIAAIMIGILYFLIRTRDLSAFHIIAYSLVAGGGIGNLVDRVMKQTVTDFINMGFGSLRTGIFNVADMAIMLALFLLVGESFRKDKQ